MRMQKPAIYFTHTPYITYLACHGGVFLLWAQHRFPPVLSIEIPLKYTGNPPKTTNTLCFSRKQDSCAIPWKVMVVLSSQTRARAYISNFKKYTRAVKLSRCPRYVVFIVGAVALAKGGGLSGLIRR